MEELAQPEGFAAGFVEGNVFHFAGRIRHSFLAVGRPSEDGTSVLKSSLVRFFSPKRGNWQPQPV